MTNARAHHLFLSVLFIPHGQFYVAQALEYDIAAQGSSIEQTKRAFERAFFGRLLLDRQMNRKPLSTLGPAPQKYWDMFQRIVRERGSEPAQALQDDPDLPPAFMIPAFPDALSGNHSSQP